MPTTPAATSSSTKRTSPTRTSATAPAKRAKLVGYDNFVRNNPKSDRFDVKRFHHLELLCGDAKVTASILCTALGFRPIAHSNMMTGNLTYASYAVGSGSVVFVCTAPYGDPAAGASPKAPPNPAFSPSEARDKFTRHGVHVCAVGVHVADAAHAHAQAVAGGAESLVAPLTDEATGVVTAEVKLYPGGDAAMRFISGERLDELPILPGYVPTPARTNDARGRAGYGIDRIDHVVGNVPDLLATVDYLTAATGFHEFAEFMGLVGGAYDAKAGGKDGFAPGGASLHVASTPHGPDGGAYAGALAADTSTPVKFNGGLAFMFETSAMLKLTRSAVASEAVQEEYAECWQTLPRARMPPAQVADGAAPEQPSPEAS